MEPTADDLLSLARKYRTLAGLRRSRDAGADAGPLDPNARQQLRRLAEEFPGCLRELDTLGLEELERRARAAEQAAKGGARETWMAWIHTYHAIMRAALHVKARLGGERDPQPETVAALSAEASAIARPGVSFGPDMVRAVARPPHGRIGVVVLEAVGRLLGVPAKELQATLFRVRRRPPYDLS